MALNKYKLGDLLIQHDIRNTNNSLSNVKGISVRKEFREPTSKVNKKELSNYKLVYPNQFGSVQTTHNERCFAFAYNDTDNIVLISPVNLVFSVKDENVLLSRWLQLYFCRQEFDRYARFHSWGSARETFSWDDICNVEIELPSIEVQKKYVNIYNAMLENQKCYERGLEDLKLVCDAYIENLRKKMPCEVIAPYIKEHNEKNLNNAITLFQGVNVDHVFTDPKRIAEDSENGSVVRTGQFAFNKVMKAHNTKLPIALREGPDCVVSNSYQVFEVINTAKLLPKYLLLWLNRDETQRYAGFISFGTTRDIFTFENLGEISIPLPNIKIQQDIVDIFSCYQSRTKINEKLKSQIKNICPILIKGSIEEEKTKEV